MIALDTARTVNAALVQARPMTAVFIGGTSGIGKARGRSTNTK
jgi:hypothetical protein